MSLFDSAKRLVDQDRQKDYGDPRHMWTVVSEGWKLIFGFGVNAKTAVIAMIWLKIARELIKAKKDNRDDLAGYLLILDRLEDNNEQTLQRGVDSQGDIPESRPFMDGEDTSDRDTQPSGGRGMLRVKSILGRISGD